MKKIELTLSICAALLMVSTAANAEDQYPASDFQPKVVFSDDSSGSSSSSAPAAAPAAPASSSSDSDYPAANFQPKVVFEDKEYKHTDTISNSSSSSSSNAGAASDSSSTGAAATGAAQKDESSAGYLLGLIVLGIAGYVLFKKGVGATAGGGKAASASGITGVARYLLKSSGTGVSRYLEKNAINAPAGKTGVAKYLASQGSSESTVGRAATGVEKYMRNKG